MSRPCVCLCRAMRPYVCLCRAMWVLVQGNASLCGCHKASHLMQSTTRCMLGGILNVQVSGHPAPSCPSSQFDYLSSSQHNPQHTCNASQHTSYTSQRTTDSSSEWSPSGGLGQHGPYGAHPSACMDHAGHCTGDGALWHVSLFS